MFLLSQLKNPEFYPGFFFIRYDHNTSPYTAISGYTIILSTKLCNTIHEILNHIIPIPNAINRKSTSDS